MAIIIFKWLSSFKIHTFRLCNIALLPDVIWRNAVYYSPLKLNPVSQKRVENKKKKKRQQSKPISVCICLIHLGWCSRGRVASTPSAICVTPSCNRWFTRLQAIRSTRRAGLVSNRNFPSESITESNSLRLVYDLDSRINGRLIEWRKVDVGDT